MAQTAKTHQSLTHQDRQFQFTLLEAYYCYCYCYYYHAMSMCNEIDNYRKRYVKIAGIFLAFSEFS